MSDTSDRLRAEIETAAAGLTETWERLGSVHKVVGGGCSCGAHGVVLRLSDFEQDIVEYLRNEGMQHQRRDVLSLLDRDARTEDRWSVTNLLASLSNPDCDAADLQAAKFVLDRLANTVASFDAIHRGR